MESYHNHISQTKPVSLPSFGKHSENEVATELLTAVVDVTFMPHNNSEIS